MNLEKDFNKIYSIHAPKVYKLCLGYASGDEYLAKEWHQKAFIKVWNYRKSFKNKSSISTWIYRIAVNVCLSDLRKSTKNMPITENTLSSNSIDDDENTMDKDIAKMYQCINQLTEQNKALVLLELEDISQVTIAETLGLAHGTVRTRLNRIRKSLLKCIKNEK